MLEKNSTITAISFPQLTFWGDPFTKVDSWYLRRGASTYHRLFKWEKDINILRIDLPQF